MVRSHNGKSAPSKSILATGEGKRLILVDAADGGRQSQASGESMEGML